MTRHRMPRRPLLALLLLAVLAPPLGAEEESHPIEPAAGEIARAFEERGDAYVIRQYELRALSQLSYLVGSQGKALVVDPLRDVDVYVRDAKALGLEIVKVPGSHRGDSLLVEAEGSQLLAASVMSSLEPST